MSLLFRGLSGDGLEHIAPLIRNHIYKPIYITLSDRTEDNEEQVARLDLVENSDPLPDLNKPRSEIGRTISPDEACDAVATWIVQRAGMNTTGHRYRKFRIRILTPKGRASLDRMTFRLDNERYVNEDERRSWPSVPEHDVHRAAADAEIELIRSLRSTTVEVSNAINGMVRELSETTRETRKSFQDELTTFRKSILAVYGEHFERLTAENAQLRKLMRRSMTKILDLEREEVARTSEREREVREVESRNKLFTDVTKEILDASQYALAVFGGLPKEALQVLNDPNVQRIVGNNPERIPMLAKVMVEKKELLAALTEMPDVVEALQDPEVVSMLRDPAVYELLKDPAKRAFAMHMLRNLSGPTAQADQGQAASRTPGRSEESTESVEEEGPTSTPGEEGPTSTSGSRMSGQNAGSSETLGSVIDEETGASTGEFGREAGAGEASNPEAGAVDPGLVDVARTLMASPQAMELLQDPMVESMLLNADLMGMLQDPAKRGQMLGVLAQAVGTPAASEDDAESDPSDD